MKILNLFFIAVLLASCQSATDVVEDTTCIGDDCEIIRYSMPNGNDLVLETAHHVIQVDAQPNVKYGYYVWAGDKSTSDDPDLIVEDGSAMVLVEE